MVVHRKNQLGRIAGALVGVVALASVMFLGTKTAAGKKPPKPPPVGGLIYFKQSPAIYSTRPDGSERTHVTDGGTLTEPSQLRHGGLRWFFTALPVAAEIYPDGMQRYEIFVQSEGGDLVQLSDDPTLQPSNFSSSYLHARWSLGDTRVSWLGRRWGADSNGNDIVTEIGLFAIDLPVDVAQLAVPLVPQRVPVAYPLLDTSQHGLIPDPLGYDWSPDATAVAIATDTDGLWLADLLAYTGEEDVQPFQISTSGRYPRWSPAGTRIAFEDQGVKTMTPLGTDLVTVVPDKIRGGWQGAIRYMHPFWSPDGTHLTFEKRRFGGDAPFPEIDVCRATAEGDGLQVLTNDIKDPLVNLGWTAE